ncbi:efflux RND transporter permease subunit [Clostridium formicaceticum]|uniref:Acriflavin resistance protein n=1 Tax=Clostridium formicaceticum TaxID=1497 RepID=A0AAC9WHE8_9CLOT|nr:efflux RND transporter permease subunit [Clostridium formicaceticum]AOY77105.1 acriflavin resistance protein [Clostridium formicaceticum]ARE87615.1 Multidrug resistance protein MdtC [Clostridium formicaceticum]
MIKWSVEHKSIILLFVILILVTGGFLYGVMERQENPTVAGPVGVIKTIYPGATPEDIEKLIVKPIEDEISKISDIKTIESFAMDSIGIVKVTLKDLSDEKIDKAWDEVKEGLDTVKSSLPSNAYEPTIETDLASSYGIILGLTSQDYTYQDLSNVANKLKEELSKDSGVKAVDIDGEIDDEVHIYLDMVKLEQYGVSPTEIATVIKARNINIPGGNLVINQVKVPVQVSGEYKDIEEIKDTIIAVSTETGTPIYLKNVADVVIIQEKKEVFASVNNEKALLIGIKYMEEENIVAIGERLDTIINEFRKKQLYENMELIRLTDQAAFTKDAINLFEYNLIAAILLVVIVVLITMGVRSAIVVSLPIPVVIVMVFIFMYLSHTPLHQVSIASLIISLSLLVANGIVANDNINVYLERGYDRVTACTKGVEEVKIPILTSTLTTVASFLPLAMMQGVAGKFVKSLPILVSIALMGSYITALTVIPATGYKFLKVKEKDAEEKKIKTKIRKVLKVDGMSRGIVNFYGKLLKAALNIPLIVILIFIGIFIVSLFIVPSLGVQLFPPVERDQYVIDVAVQDGSDAEKTEKVATMIGELLQQEASIRNFTYKVGDGMLKYYITFTPNDRASNKAQFLVNGDRSEAGRIEKELGAKIPGVSINIRELETAVPVAYPVQVRVSGPEIAELRRIAEEIKEIIYDVPGVKNLENNYGYDSYKLNIKVNEEKANLVGITNYDIASTVRMAVNGLEVSELKEEDIEKDALPIILKIPDEKKRDRDILDDIFVTSQITGKNVPIHQIAEIETNSSLNKIVRRNTTRTITIGMFVEKGYNSNEILSSFQVLLEDYVLPDGYTMAFGGESEERNDAFDSMKIPSVLAVAIIYLILVIQFGSLRMPLIIMGTIPLSFIGIIWGLKWMNYPIGFMALLGAVSLMGVVVNNGIVLLDYIRILVKEKDDIKEAIVEACKTRLRPIMIGMITTVISLIPLAKSGGALWAPMATSIIFGMLISSILTLFIIPCAYFVIRGKHVWIPKPIKG